jgi:hypothetical protein
MKSLYSVLVALAILVFSPVLSAQESPLPNFTEPAVMLGEPTATSLVGFRKALISTAEQAVKSGEISRVELFKLRVATMNPKVLKQMHQACAEQVLSDGKAKSFSAIDWSKLIEIIKELLPVILQIISLFS